ncbi:tetratricopeptide repeat protein [Chryseobacterium sp. MIQD13]|uniref:tetratricopeptide repeat protein n=1 Tax=Chryseobacterium sp. MIQD13 TaxID=3422310 RepID=UPI003D277E60
MKKILLICGLAGSVLCFSQKKEMTTAFKTKNYKEALSLGQKVLENNSGDFEANLIISASYNSLGDFQKALPYSKKLEVIAESDEQKSWTFMQLMVANYGLDDKETSRKYYDQAKKINAQEKTVVELDNLGKVLGFDSFYDQWTTIETENMIFHFDPSINQETRNKIVKTRQKAFVKVNEFFETKLPKKIDFFVWGSNDVYNQFLKRSLGFTLANYCVSHNRLNQTAGHEITHNLSFWQGNKGKIRTEFINEGIGVCFDQNENNKLETAKEVYKKSPIDIKKVWAENQKSGNEVLYPVSGAFVQYLINYDKARFLELNNNQTYENAKTIYGNTIDSLIEDFTDKLK